MPFFATEHIKELEITFFTLKEAKTDKNSYNKKSE